MNREMRRTERRERLSSAVGWIAVIAGVSLVSTLVKPDEDDSPSRAPSTVIRPAMNGPANPYSGDLDCADIGRQVYVGLNDPNFLDADNDGIGCEGW